MLVKFNRNLPWWVTPTIIIVAAILIVVLWRFAFPLAKLCVPSHSGNASVALDTAGLLRVGSCIVGILTIKSAIPGVIGGLAWLHVSGYPYNPHSIFVTKLTLATNVVLLTFGVFLLFGNATVAKVLRSPAGEVVDG
jgi:hypothetical protein